MKGIALITGAAQGIGRSIALRLAQDGYDIGLNDLSSNLDQLRAVANDIEKIGRKVLLVLGDVSVDEDVKRLVNEVSKELGGLDVMVANAGIALLTSIVNTDVEAWDRVMAVNARGVFLCYKYAAQQMIKQGRGGRIIGASSVLGKSAEVLLNAYNASKFAVRGLTQTAALELGRYNITVNSYSPGPIDTPLFKVVDSVLPADMELFQTLANDWSAPGVFKRKGQPEDIASIVSYLASKEAHFITGQCITVDGGINLS